MSKPYIIKPNGRSPVRTELGIVPVLIAGKFHVYDNTILINGKFQFPISVERVTNRSGKLPHTLLKYGGFEFGKHTIQLDNGHLITFYVNPPY